MEFAKELPFEGCSDELRNIVNDSKKYIQELDVSDNMLIAKVMFWGKTSQDETAIDTYVSVSYYYKASPSLFKVTGRVSVPMYLEDEGYYTSVDDTILAIKSLTKFAIEELLTIHTSHPTLEDVVEYISADDKQPVNIEK